MPVAGPMANISARCIILYLSLDHPGNVTYKHGVCAWLCISSSGSLWLCIGAVLFLFLFFNQISCLLKVDFLSFRSTEAHTSSLQILLSIRNTASKVVYKELKSHRAFLAQGICWHIYKKKNIENRYFRKHLGLRKKIYLKIRLYYIESFSIKITWLRLMEATVHKV